MTFEIWADIRGSFTAASLLRYSKTFAALACMLPSIETAGVASLTKEENRNERERVSTIAILSPHVEFISMETDEPLEIPTADKRTLSSEISQAFVDYLTKKGKSTRLVDIAELQSSSDDLSPKLLFDIVRGKDDNEYANQVRASIAEIYSNANYLLIRSRFYLSYWGRSSQGWRVANTIVNGGMPGKRMVIDARLYSQKDFLELWRGLAQESVTPRKSQKGLAKAVQSLGKEIVSIKSTQIDNDYE